MNFSLRLGLLTLPVISCARLQQHAAGADRCDRTVTAFHAVI